LFIKKSLTENKNKTKHRKIHKVKTRKR